MPQIHINKGVFIENTAKCLALQGRVRDFEVVSGENLGWWLWINKEIEVVRVFFFKIILEFTAGIIPSPREDFDYRNVLKSAAKDHDWLKLVWKQVSNE